MTTQDVSHDDVAGFLRAHGFSGVDLDAADARGATALMLAARLASPDVLRALIDAGADIHATNLDGNQALWLACAGDRAENIDVLIAAGATIDHVNATGATPLMFAASSGRAAAVAALLAAGADPRLDTGLGLAAIDMAATRECLDLMRAATRRAG
jgi:ankyrin repeat protein